jgi:peptidoglycan/LPS O-acetylase OafA/YrhL
MNLVSMQWSDEARRRRIQVLVCALLLVLCVVAPAAADPFQTLGTKLEAAGRVLAPALGVVMMLVAGAAIGLGSDNGGKWATKVLFGGLFLTLAAGGGTVVMNMLRELTGGS